MDAGSAYWHRPTAPHPYGAYGKWHSVPLPVFGSFRSMVYGNWDSKLASNRGNTENRGQVTSEASQSQSVVLIAQCSNETLADGFLARLRWRVACVDVEAQTGPATWISEAAIRGEKRDLSRQLDHHSVPWSESISFCGTYFSVLIASSRRAINFPIRTSKQVSSRSFYNKIASLL
eukprot:759214-Hanusia_phi.AAC.1